MPGIMQEKFQVDNAFTSEAQDPGPWASDSSARTSKAAPLHYHRLPPGMDLAAQPMTDQSAMQTVTSDQNDRSPTFSAAAARTGYQRKRMSPTEDEYTQSHTDAFYDEIKVDGEVGFAERNNVLDRL